MVIANGQSPSAKSECKMFFRLPVRFAVKKKVLQKKKKKSSQSKFLGMEKYQEFQEHVTADYTAQKFLMQEMSEALHPLLKLLSEVVTNSEELSDMWREIISDFPPQLQTMDRPLLRRYSQSVTELQGIQSIVENLVGAVDLVRDAPFTRVRFSDTEPGSGSFTVVKTTTVKFNEDK